MSSPDRKASRLKQKQAATVFRRAMQDGARQQALFYQCLNLMPFWKRVKLACRIIAGKARLNANPDQQAA